MRLVDGDALFQELKTAEEGSMVAVKHIQKYEVYTAESILLTTLSVIEDVINNAPTIDPVKHGRWIVTDHDQHCELCGFVVSKEGEFTDRHAVERLWRYCPSCGARMDAN